MNCGQPRKNFRDHISVVETSERVEEMGQSGPCKDKQWLEKGNNPRNKLNLARIHKHYVFQPCKCAAPRQDQLQWKASASKLQTLLKTDDRLFGNLSGRKILVWQSDLHTSGTKQTMSNYGASVVTHCHTIFVPLCLNPRYAHSPCGRGGSSPQLADRRQRLKFGLEEGLLMKSRIINQSPLWALVIQLKTAQHRRCMISGFQQQPTPQKQHPISPVPPESAATASPTHADRPHWALRAAAALARLAAHLCHEPCWPSSRPVPPSSLHHAALCRQKSRLPLPTWRSALSFWLGKKASLFGCPSSLMRNAWAQSIPCFMGLGLPALASRLAAGLQQALGEVVFPAAFAEAM